MAKNIRHINDYFFEDAEARELIKKEAENRNDALFNLETKLNDIAVLKNRYINIEEYADKIENDDWSTVINYIVNNTTGGITIFIPNKVYECKTPIIINRSNIRILGESKGSILKVVEEMDKFIIYQDASEFLDVAIEYLHIDCDYKCNYGVYCDVWVGDSQFMNVKIGKCNQTIFHMPMWMCSVENCWFYNSVNGLCLPLTQSTRATSTTIKSVFCSDCSENGFIIDATYMSLINCGADRCKIAYFMRDCKGVNLISCGAEGCRQIVKSTSWWGGSIQGFYGLNNGAEDLTSSNYMFEFGMGVNLTISGISGSYVGKAKILGLTSSDYGSENITILDNSISPDVCYYKSNWHFNNPIKFIRGGETSKDLSYNVANIDELNNYIKTLPDVINHTVTFTLTSAFDLPEGKQIKISNKSGSGSIIIAGAFNITTPAYIPVQITNCSAKVFFKQFTITNTLTNAYQGLFQIRNSSVYFDGVSFVTGVICGYIISAKNASTAVVGSNCVKNGAFASNGVFPVFEVDETSTLTNKMA